MYTFCNDCVEARKQNTKNKTKNKIIIHTKFNFDWHFIIFRAIKIIVELIALLHFVHSTFHAFNYTILQAFITLLRQKKKPVGIYVFIPPTITGNIHASCLVGRTF